jgi:predicted RNase H-like HicB family nuclease
MHNITEAIQACLEAYEEDELDTPQAELWGIPVFNFGPGHEPVTA